MIKPFLKTLSLAFVTFAAATSFGLEQKPGPHRAAMSIESVRFACSTQADIERGWENQQALLEARLAAKASEALRVPGAIISPPFPNFAKYRTDVPSLTTSRRNAKPANSTGRQSTGRASATHRM